MLTKYKVGQQVRISADLDMDMESPGVNEDMMDMIGQVFTVKAIHSSWYTLGNGWSWSDEMLEPVIRTQDEAFESLVNGSLSDSEYEQIIKEIQNT